ncbi:MAG: hypothetical protein HKN47_09885, partial [Pirellulaceae bacterium]|nr:hypothetical protein [Pirellulaceae bacterium]
MSRCTQTLLILLIGLVCAPLQAEMIWIEGEAASSKEMRGHGWYDSVKKAELSGGEWLSHFHQGDSPIASYQFNAEQSGDYDFWIRANTVAAKYSIRLNDGPWTTVSLDKTEQTVNLASDGKPDLRFVSWVNAGNV